MAFVNEKISDADRERFGIDKRYISWMADHERDAFLLGRGGRGEPHSCSFFFFWNGSAIDISTEQRWTGNYDTGLNITYTITHLGIPDATESERQAIHLLLEEALNAYGITGGNLPTHYTTNVIYSGRK